MYLHTIELEDNIGSPANGKAHGIPEMVQDIFIGHMNWIILKSSSSSSSSV